MTKLAQPAHPATIAANTAVLNELDFRDTGDFDDAARGFMGTIPDALVTQANGNVVWGMQDYQFLQSEQAAPTVNPSLWRQARLNMHHGLFKVVDGIYQVRGLDLANITFIEGEKGIIIIDPLTVEESAKASLALYRQHRGNRPVVAVIYSHSHRDHYGGVRGVIDEADVKAGKVAVIAPSGFMEEAVSEAVLAGVPMRRRAAFQFGSTLAKGVTGQVDAGLGKTTALGTWSVIEPTQLISDAEHHQVIDGVHIVFQLTPGTEAPAEMNFYFPELKALNLAENACHTMHNLCPLRGAKTRDSLAWSRYIDEAIDKYGANTEVVFAQHHWPIWGTQRAIEFMQGQRDLYRFLHDQTLRLMSHGLTPREISEQLLLPNSLSRKWHARGYYGAVAHNVAAIYAHYMGPYEGNPALLHRLTPVDAAKKYVAYMGGEQAVLALAQQDYARGEFRWVAELANHLVFANSQCAEARQLGANALEQMGYQAESATWRNSFILGAQELRHGVANPLASRNGISIEMLSVLPVPRLLDALAIRVDGLKVQDLELRLDWQMVGEEGCHRITVSNGAMSHQPGSHGASADATVHICRVALDKLLREKKGLLQGLIRGEIEVQGAQAPVQQLFDNLDDFDPMFNILEP